MAKLTTDIGTAAALHPRENIFRTSALASATSDTAIRADGAQSFVFALSGTFVATLLVEGSVDGTNWFTLPMRPYDSASKLLAVSAAAVGRWVGSNPGWSQLRVRCSAFTSGSAVFTLAASIGALDHTMEGLVASATVTATAAAATALTLTIPAPGAGLRQYLTMVRIERHTSALLTAGATPTIITTTNLPGARVYSIPVDAAAAGTVYEKVENFSRPLAASAQNTAVTIVAALVAATIWRFTADYYVAP